MRFGILGVGTIGTAVVHGLCRAGARAGSDNHVVLSPRSAARSKELAATYPNVEIAPENQALLDAVEVVVLAVRPEALDAVLAALRFRPDHRILSLVASAAWTDLLARIAPATSLARLLPMPPCARGRGAVLAYRLADDLRPSLAGLGPIFAVEDEPQLAALVGLTGLTASLFELFGRVSDWAAGHGVGRSAAERYLATTVAAMCAERLDAESPGFAALAADAVTPGGLNDACLTHLQQTRATEPFVTALRALSRRLGLAEDAGGASGS